MTEPFDDPGDTRLKLLERALVHAPFDGWSDDTLRLAAEDLGLDPAAAHLAFPRGTAEVIAYWSEVADAAMLIAYRAVEGEDMRFRERIAFLVRARIEAVAEHREALRRALAHMGRPSNAAQGMKALYRTVDEIWHAAGDRSTDFSFYTKRATLAGVFSTTLLFWLDDASEGARESWAFLERRIDNVMQIPKGRAAVSNLGRALPDPRRFARLVADRLREGAPRA